MTRSTNSLSVKKEKPSTLWIDIDLTGDLLYQVK